jgi:LmbE family N-acetylglucosaminyl deacetylase
VTALVVEPHGDDAALFAAYACCRESENGGCTIVTVLDSGPLRDDEGDWAARHLGCDTIRLGISEGRPNWDNAANALDEVRHRMMDQGGITAVYAPFPDDDGHDHHNRVGHLAAGVFGTVTWYTTYSRSSGRTLVGVEVQPEPRWIVRKLRALACYESQIANPMTRPWFTGGLDEWVV